MDLFADNALRILDVAMDGLAAGQTSSTLTFLTDANEGLVILSETNEPLEQLRRARGASAAYRVGLERGELQVNGVAAGRTISLSRATRKRPAPVLPNDMALYSVIGQVPALLPAGVAR